MKHSSVSIIYSVYLEIFIIRVEESVFRVVRQNREILPVLLHVVSNCIHIIIIIIGPPSAPGITSYNYLVLARS